MFDYQVCRGAYLLKEGITEADAPPSIDDMDSMYSALGESMKKNPEEWH